MCKWSLFLVGTASMAFGGDPSPPHTKIARLFIQDHPSRTLSWTDVTIDQNGKADLGKLSPMEGIPKIDPTTQTLVQMRGAKGRIVLGIRDKEKGTIASGWVLMSAGAKFREHGDHGHWDYTTKPFVFDNKIDTEQGNPAHVYEYDEVFYLANDSKNGFTQLDPERWFRSVEGKITLGKPRFFEGGGNHITLAAKSNRVAYATWIDGDGPNKGRVDVINMAGPPGKGYSFTLPTGVIHGATACANKIFFAPADGICWVLADSNMDHNPEKIEVFHISLGKDGTKPRRTGAFANHGNHVFCVTGKGKAASLVILNATEDRPNPITIPLHGGENNKPLTPAVVMVQGKKAHAFVFHDHDKKETANDLLEIFELDPNGDGDYADARLVKVFPVGSSCVDGHYGHHDVAFNAEGNYAFFTNPGDGTISVMNMTKWEIVGNFPVGGMPTHLLVWGGSESED
jgi:hypothetical protein